MNQVITTYVRNTILKYFVSYCALASYSKVIALFIRKLHRSAITLKALTDEVNNLDYLLILTPVKGDKSHQAASKQAVLEVDVLEARKIGKTGFKLLQTVIARRLGQGISKTSGLLWFSWYAVGNTYQK